jgi:large subunit ribosomal protein L28
MPGRCSYCEKAPVTGKKYVHRGVAKYKGGIGRKVTGKTKRWFRPNLQHLKVVETNGHVHRAWVCTKCIKSGRINKAPNQKQMAALRAEKAAKPAK